MEGQRESKAVARFRSALQILSQHTVFQYKEGLETLDVYIGNLIHYPHEKKFRKVKLSNIHFQERLGRLTGSMEAMKSIGFEVNGKYLRRERRTDLLELHRILQEKHQKVSKQFEQLPGRHPSDHKFTSVAGVGEHHDIGRRQNMEDDALVVDGFCGIPTQGYFGLYDGHGGRGTVDFVVRTLHQNLEQVLKSSPNVKVAQAFEAAYLTTDAQLRRRSELRSGSTAVSCIVRKLPDGSKILYHANVGDSRAILCRGTEAKRLTIDHKPTVPEEAKRIRDAGGKVTNGRVSVRGPGLLAVSRALGDHILKENNIVAASPYCGEIKLCEEDRFLILACDGLWDVVEDQEAMDYLLRTYDAKVAEQETDINTILRDISQGLVQLAMENDTQDNVSVMCIKL